MEKIPASCAMDWSIQLDKGLRSKIPGKSVEETIEEVGCRLQWWSREPPLKMAEFDMFCLIPGEDNLFANAILLRLADAFVSGDTRIKLCVVRLFLSELKRRKIKRGSHKLIGEFLPNCIVDYMEFLRKVKTCFDVDNVEVRALTLALFGCWADFAKDIAEIRYLILSSAVSSHLLEVKASLFAAGCFSEVSEDFGSVFLEMLVNIMSSSEIPVAGRLAGARAFGKLGCSTSLANRAYKKGLKLVLDSAEEDFLVAMLVSLSRVASKSPNLISEQVHLLRSYLNQDRAPRLQATSLKCLNFILVKGMVHGPVTADVTNTIFSIFNEAKFPPAMHLEVLQILYRNFLYKLLNLRSEDILEIFTKLLAVSESVMQSSKLSQRLLAIRILTDISLKFIGRAETSFDGVGSTLAALVISFVIDHLSILMESERKFCLPNLALDQEVRSLLSLIICLVEECPDQGSVVLDKIYLYIDHLVSRADGIISSDDKESIDHNLKAIGTECFPSITSKRVIYLSKVVAFCLKNLEKAGTLNSQQQNIAKLTGERIDHCSLFNGYVHTVYSLLLQPYYRKLNEIDENCIQKSNLSTYDQNCYVQNEIIVLEGARKVLAGENKWAAYKVGKCAAGEGAWLAAALIFSQLTTMVQSDSCSCWLKCLHLFSYSEMTLQFLVLPKQRSILLNWLEINRISILSPGDDLLGTVNASNYEINSTSFIDNLAGACKILHSSREALKAIILKLNPLLFQKWFLALRVRFVTTVVDIVSLLGTITLTQYSNRSEGQLKESGVQGSECQQQVMSLIQSLRLMSTNLSKLAREFDLVATSFLGMGHKSLMIISELALNCSILAFTTEFTLSFPKLRSLANRLEHSGESLQAVLIQDLVVRFRDTDNEISKQLWSLLKACEQPRTCNISRFRIQKLKNASEVGGIHKLCKYAVSGVVGLQNSANNVDADDEVALQITNDGLQLLLDVVLKWMNIPFRIPNYFFRVRPSISAQLFASNNSCESGEVISVLPGFHLALNLCLQLSNIPQDFQVRRAKLYCILYCKPSYLVPCGNGEKKSQIQLEYCNDIPDDMLELNEKLVQYVIGRTEIGGTSNRANTHNRGIVETYTCLKPNEKGQGFSTCLLDVSAFPLGSYIIKWHSCCVDDKGSYWSLPSLNAGPVFIVQGPDDSTK